MLLGSRQHAAPVWGTLYGTERLVSLNYFLPVSLFHYAYLLFFTAGSAFAETV
jgi:hypothetical protein